MHHLVYLNDSRTAVQRGDSLDHTSECTRCDLYKNARTVCMRPEGEPGGLLIVTDYPSRAEDSVGRPLLSQSGKMLRGSVDEHWSGPIAIANAISCAPGRSKTSDKHVDACAPYLASVIEEVEPTRILCAGNIAAHAVLGKKIAVLQQRRSFGWLADELCEPSTPVFVVPHPTSALKNQFVRLWFNQDVEWALTCPVPDLPPVDGTFCSVTTAEEAEEVAGEVSLCPWIAVDCEWFGRPYDDVFRLTSVCVCTPDGRVWTWGEEALYQLGGGQPGAVLKEILEDETVGKTGSDFRVDVVALHAWGATVRGELSDVRLKLKILEPEADGSLGKMAYRVGYGGHKDEFERSRSKAMSTIKRAITSASKKGSRPDWEKLSTKLGFDVSPLLARSLEQCGRGERDYSKYSHAVAPTLEIQKYNALDGLVTSSLEVSVDRRLHEDEAAEFTWRELMQPGARAMMRVEQWGVAADADAISAYDEYLTIRKNQCRDALKGIADIDWGLVGTTAAVKDYLFGKCGIKARRFTDSGAPSTDATSLRLIENEHPAIPHLLALRHYAAQDKYASGMLPHVRGDGRIHSSFHVDGARTGRGSSSDPNLYNITNPEKDPELGPLARNSLVAELGNVLVEADYGQLELRVMAFMANDPVMREIFLRGEDIHMEMARALARTIFNIAPEDAGEHERRICKTIVFALAYGKTDPAMAEELGVPVADITRARKGILGQFKNFLKFSHDTLRECRRTGHVWTWWRGRRAHRRPMWKILDADPKARTHAENGAVNARIQGTAAFFALASLPALVDWIDRERFPAKVVLSVYDSLMLEVRERHAEEAAAKMVDVMTSHDSDGVPMLVDVKVGRAWGSMQKMKI